MASLTVPTLLDFWMTSLTLSTPWGWASVMVEPVMVMRPGAVCIGVSGLTMPFSSANETAKGFIVEPGSKVSVKARLRNCSPLKLIRLAGE